MRIKELISILNGFDNDFYIDIEITYYDPEDGRIFLNRDIQTATLENKTVTLR